MEDDQDDEVLINHAEILNQLDLQNDAQLQMLLRDKIMQAHYLVEKGSLLRAFDTYFEAFEENPECKVAVEAEFRQLLTRINQTLDDKKKIDDIFYNFERALAAYPDNKFILNDIGKYLHKYNYHVEACSHFQKALKVEPGYVAAEKNLNAVKNFLVERWHFRMLNDKIRNTAFKDALHQTVHPRKDLVLDIGSGTGLLSLYADECDPRGCTACDASATMIDISRSVFEVHDKGHIIPINKLSTECCFVDICGKRQLIITELFDAGLFGEHVLQTLAHAREHLMAPKGWIIPCNAEFFIVGAQCEFLNQRYRLNTPAKNILNISDIVHVSSSEPYDCEDVDHLNDIEYLTDTQLLVQVDFNDSNDINQVLECSVPYEVNFLAKQPGELNVIIGWFNLLLGSDIIITTDPNSNQRAEAWQQAVFYDFIPKSLAEGDTFTAKFSSAHGKLSLISDSTSEISRVSPEMIRFLNDSDYMQMITSSTGSICTYLSQIDDISSQSIVDLQPFPVFGLLMLRYGAQSLICYAKTDQDEEFIEKVFTANKIPKTQYTILIDSELAGEAFINLKFHAIFINYIDLCGELNITQKSIASLLIKEHLLPHGLVLPHKLELHGQLISSDWLRITNRLYDGNVHNYRIAEFLNKYQVSQNVNIDIRNLEYEELSEAVVIAEVNGETEPALINVTVTKAGYANAILCWYEIQLMENEMSITTKRGNSSVDSIAFLADPEVETSFDNPASIFYCVDDDGAFKLLADED